MQSDSAPGNISECGESSTQTFTALQSIDIGVTYSRRKIETLTLQSLDHHRLSVKRQAPYCTSSMEDHRLKRVTSAMKMALASPPSIPTAILEEAPSEAPELDNWGDLESMRREFMKSQPIPKDPVNSMDVSVPAETKEVANTSRLEDGLEAAPGSATSSLRDFVLSADLFGERSRDDPSVQVIPLVRVWLELEEHLTADTIPSPEELFKEVDEIEM